MTIIKSNVSSHWLTNIHTFRKIVLNSCMFSNFEAGMDIHTFDKTFVEKTFFVFEFRICFIVFPDCFQRLLMGFTENSSKFHENWRESMRANKNQ